MDLGLAGKVAIITGGGGGCGRAYCLAFAQEGSCVVIADLDGEAAKRTAEEVKARGGKALAMKVDVTKWEEVTDMVKKALEEFGQIDILVNNAGVRGMSKLEDTPEELWERDINVNLKGAFYCAKAVTRHMKERRYGKIVNQSSLSAFNGHRAGGHIYAAAKAGLLGFTRSIAQELGAFNITVNAIAPGMIDTPFIGNMPAERKAVVAKTCAMQRIGVAEDFVGIVLLLASDRSSYISAQTIVVDGGLRPT